MHQDMPPLSKARLPRSPKNRIEKRGMRNKGWGVCKKANAWHTLYGGDILVLLKADNGHFCLGFQSEPGLMQKLAGIPIPMDALSGPDHIKYGITKTRTRTRASSASGTNSPMLSTTMSTRSLSDISDPVPRHMESTKLPETQSPSALCSNPSASNSCSPEALRTSLSPPLRKDSSQEHMVDHGFDYLKSLVDTCFG